MDLDWATEEAEKGELGRRAKSTGTRLLKSPNLSTASSAHVGSPTDYDADVAQLPLHTPPSPRPYLARRSPSPRQTRSTLARPHVAKYVGIFGNAPGPYACHWASRGTCPNVGFGKVMLGAVSAEGITRLGWHKRTGDVGNVNLWTFVTDSVGLVYLRCILLVAEIDMV